MKKLKEINEKISQNRESLESWVEGKAEKEFIPLYSSVDLRISDYKIAPVDTNIFPAGFNNLSQESRDRASELFKAYFSQKHPNVRNITIIPELHTRNTYYWENVSVLRSILVKVGYSVDIGIVSDDFTQDSATFKAQNGEDVTAYKVKKEDHKVFTSNSVPDLLLINNDFSERCPKSLNDIIQPVEPPVEIGWHTRRKSVHFDFYNRLAREAADIIGIDPWIVSIETVPMEGVDFDDPADRERVAEVAAKILDRLKREYEARGVSDKPYLFIKSNSGTYGMAVISVAGPDEIRNLNAEGRKRMRVSKGGKPVRDIVIQEGIPTTLGHGADSAAEPVFYLVNARVAGGFLRVNSGKSGLENLNTRGMEFVPLYYHGAPVESGAAECVVCSPAHELISSIASIAAGYEIEEILREGGCKDDETGARA